jgi:cobalt-zinc-cadmium efflux system protein
MAHEHHHHEVKGKNLVITILLNAGISLAELIGGIFSGSIALISDAIHNFSDVLSLVVSYIAQRLSKREANEKSTFGYRRSEILAAFINASTLIVLAFYIFYEAIMRFFEPVEVAPDLVIWLALASIAVNGISVLMIKSDAEHSMNMKSAYIHLFGDMITSIAVLVGGILMKYFQIYWIDPMFSIMIAIYLVYMSWDIFRSSLKIMMQFTPEDVDVKVIVKEVNSIEGVRNIHHIHIWQINEHDIMLEAHIDFENDVRISEFEKFHKQVRSVLKNHHINHITLQPEFSSDCDKGIIGHGDC